MSLHAAKIKPEKKLLNTEHCFSRTALSVRIADVMAMTVSLRQKVIINLLISP